ncbi:MAG: cupin domain-containing protein [Ignavibacteriota bacterium]
MLRNAILVFALASAAFGADPNFLRRQLQDAKPSSADLTTGAKGASYRALFGIGDSDADQLKTIVRYGELTVAPEGATAIVSYPSEEQMYFVTEGSGTLLYDAEKAPIRKYDFVYLPVGVKHGVVNSSSAPLHLIVMGYRIPPATQVQPTPKLMLANADDVKLQILGQHGPTTQFKLLIGPVTSKRDKLAAAYVMDSLFLMDFAPGGTNIPHNHPKEEEVYFLLRGSGDMVAGLDADGKEVRHAVTPGAAFLIKPGCQVGYYSNAKEGQEHDLILAVRSMLPRTQSGSPELPAKGQ